MDNFQGIRIWTTLTIIELFLSIYRRLTGYQFFRR